MQGITSVCMFGWLVGKMACCSVPNINDFLIAEIDHCTMGCCTVAELDRCLVAEWNRCSIVESNRCYIVQSQNRVWLRDLQGHRTFMSNGSNIVGITILKYN